MAASSCSSSSLPFSPFTLFISIPLFISLFFFSPVHSAVTCASQKLPENRTYANCTDLPVLGATLYYTYNATNNSLAVAFTAAPAKPDGWVGWGINPSPGGGMLGAGAFVAYKLDGKITVKPYNLTSYTVIEQTNKLSFDFYGLSAVDADGAYTIFAVVKLPEKAENLNQIWQVGPSVTNGHPDKHEFATDNKSAKMSLKEVVTATEHNSGGGSSTASPPTKQHSGGVMSMGERYGLGIYLGLVLVLLGFMSM